MSINDGASAVSKARTKPIWASKTFWANVVGGAAMLATAAGVEIMDAKTQAELVGGIMVVANLVLRTMTKQPVTL